MRNVVLALAAVASIGLLVPTVNSARAEDRVVVIKERGDRDHHRHWRHHHDKKVVVIKRKRNHRDHD